MSETDPQEAIKELPKLIENLQSTVRRLEELFTGRHFTLDGHLVGSLAEVVASYIYDLELLPSSERCHDAYCRRKGTRVQIKGTERNRVPMYDEPEHLLVLQMIPGFPTIYNGPGATPWNQAGKKAKNGQRTISIQKLRVLANEVSPVDQLIAVRSMTDSKIRIKGNTQ